MQLDLDRARNTTLHVSAAELGSLVGDSPAHNLAAFLHGFITSFAERDEEFLRRVRDNVCLLSDEKRRFFLRLAQELQSSGGVTASDMHRMIEGVKD